jgi:DNA polymerase elongation subunit (family B)
MKHLFYNGGNEIHTIDKNGEWERKSFSPFLIVEELEDIGFNYEVDELNNGDFPFKYIIKFDSEMGFWSARSWYNKNGCPNMFIPNFATQFLIQSGEKLYEKIKFEDLTRMQFDIETDVDKLRAFPIATKDAINTIAIRQGSFVKVIVGKEKDILLKFIKHVHELNPDILEGHNIINFDIPYILERCKRNDIDFNISRFDVLPNSYTDTLRTGELTTKFRKYNFFGRCIVDTMHLCKHDDNIKRNYPSVGLKDAAKHLGVAEENRVILKGREIFEEYKKRSKRYLQYCLEDVNEVERISSILLPPFFYQCKLVPYDLQSIITSGAAGKINNMVVNHYIRKYHSIPKPANSYSYEGGLVECRQTGVIKDVYHIDVGSLYPSIILQYDLFPKKDVLNYFRNIYPKIKDYRIKMKKAGNKPVSESFKIIINSFYGYMGYSFANFNDFDNAETVTRIGRKILTKIAAFCEGYNYGIVEIDTDGLYINKKDNTINIERLVKIINMKLPTLINVEYDGYYPNFISIKKKNYIMDDGKKLIYKGATKGRSLEPFLKEFTHGVYQGLIDNININSIYESYIEFVNNVTDVKCFIKKASLHKSLKEYAEKRKNGGNKAVAYELWSQHPKRYSIGENFHYYIYGDSKKVKAFDACQFDYEYDPDKYPINREYYLEKLRKKYKSLCKEFEKWQQKNY